MMPFSVTLNAQISSERYCSMLNHNRYNIDSLDNLYSYIKIVTHDLLNSVILNDLVQVKR